MQEPTKKRVIGAVVMAIVGGFALSFVVHDAHPTASDLSERNPSWQAKSESDKAKNDLIVLSLGEQSNAGCDSGQVGAVCSPPIILSKNHKASQSAPVREPAVTNLKTSFSAKQPVTENIAVTQPRPTKQVQVPVQNADASKIHAMSQSEASIASPSQSEASHQMSQQSHPIATKQKPVLSTVKPPYFYLQVAVLTHQSYVQRLKQALSAMHYPITVLTKKHGDGFQYTVLLGPGTSKHQLAKLKQQVLTRFKLHGLVRHYDSKLESVDV